MNKNLYAKIDDYLTKLPKNQKYMLYTAVLLIFGMILYAILPSMIDKRDILKNDIKVLKTNIKNNSIKVLKQALIFNKQKILRENQIITEQKEGINILISNLYKVPFAFFDAKEWAKTLDMVLRESVFLNLKVKYLKNSNAKDDNLYYLVKKKKHIQIAGEGKFANIIQFVYYIENLDILLKFNNIHIYIRKNKNKSIIDFDIGFDTYGVGL